MKYQVIYADPPWRYRESTAPPNRRIENQYPTMSLDEICNLEVPSDRSGSVLFLWATSPLLPEALEVIRTWGFTYKSSLVWDKEVAGMGYWFRGQHELLLAGYRGLASPPPPQLRVPSVFRCRRGAHSRKPYRIRELIASWYPSARKLEMFAREKHAGWDSMGNDVSPTLLSELGA